MPTLWFNLYLKTSQIIEYSNQASQNSLTQRIAVHTTPEKNDTSEFQQLKTKLFDMKNRSSITFSQKTVVRT